MEQEVITLLKKVQEGDEQAFDEIYRRFYHVAYLKAMSICHNDADAKDALQDAFVEVHRSLGNLRELQSFPAWLSIVIASKCNRMYRRKQLVTTNNGDVESTLAYKEERIYMDPLKNAQNENERDVLNGIINSLTDKQAELIRMVYFEEMKLHEIAQHLNIPLGTVKTRAQRAKNELRRKIELYESREKVQLHFHADTILPASLIGSSVFMIPSILQKGFQQGIKLFSQHAIVCTAATAVVVVSSVVAVTSLDTPQSTTSNKNNPLSSNTIQQPTTYAYTPISFDELVINDAQEAYYLCMNFAYEKEKDERYDKQEQAQIKAVYQQLVKTNSAYYKALQQSDWGKDFINYIETVN